MHFPARKRHAPKIHLTALIDIVFLLLVFFLLASSFVQQQGVPVILPAVEAESAEILPDLTVKIDAHGFIYFNGVEVNEDILLNLLHKHFQDSMKQTIAIQADRRVQYDRVVEVIDIAKMAGAENFLLVTERRQ